MQTLEGDSINLLGTFFKLPLQMTCSLASTRAQQSGTSQLSVGTDQNTSLIQLDRAAINQINDACDIALSDACMLADARGFRAGKQGSLVAKFLKLELESTRT